MFKKIMILIFLTLLSVNMCGCAALLVAGGAVAGGAGTAAWVSGKLVQEVDAPFEKSIRAAEYALESFNLDIVSEVKKERVAQIKSNYTDGKTIWIDIHKISPSASRIAVRVGAVADKKATRKILDRIKEYLGKQLTSITETEKKAEVIVERQAQAQEQEIVVDEPEAIVLNENLK